MPVAKALSFQAAPTLIVVELPESDQEEKKLRSGIILPETRNRETIVKGRCVAVGKLVEGGEEAYKGKVCMFGRYSGTEVEIDGGVYLFVNPKYVLGFYYGDLL